MHKQMDLNFIPCFFLRSSFIFSYKKRENRKVVRKQNARKMIKKKNNGKPA